MLAATMALARHGDASILEANQVKIRPNSLDLENPPNLVTVDVKLFLDGASLVNQINPSTVRLEDVLTPVSTGTSDAPPELTAQFYGRPLADLIRLKIYHMTLIPPDPDARIKVSLTITGQLNNGAAWEGTGEVKVYINDSSL